MSRKRKAVLVIVCILLVVVAFFGGRYWLPSCPTCPDCPKCPPRIDCPECPVCPLPPTLSIEKWVQNAGCKCGWQKEVSAQKGDWIEFKIVINVTQTMDNVLVRDAGLAKDPWTRVQDLRVNGDPVSGNIKEGISLGRLTDESREITFRAQLSKSTHRYDHCGINLLENIAEAGRCAFEVEASVRILVDVYCRPSEEDEESEIEAPKVVTNPLE